MRLLALLLLTSSVFAAEGKIRFNRDIRPILSDNCLACHGFDKNKRDSGLRLDIREEAIKPAKSGSIAIVPGKPEQSEIITRIFDDEDPMPPEKAHKTLTAAQKELFRRWVAEGANYEPHWAYTPLVKPAVPALPGVDQAIDAFIQQPLAAKKISPAPAADATTLIRRLSLDLTGLPPTPEEVAAFVKNPDIAAATTRLMKSPHFGERWAVWWLDAVRFADTVGFHGDQNQRVFPYRDYVIAAFNANKRFDVFTLEQIAGDLLPGAGEEQFIASGFNRLSMMTREGGAQPAEYIAKYQADRVRAVGGAWLGATIGCAECHDHKFDPITQKDFYSLAAYFADVKQYGIWLNFGIVSPNPELKGFTDHHPFPPEMEVRSPWREQLKNRAEAQQRRVSTQAAEKHAQAHAEWQRQSRDWLKKQPSGWLTPSPAVRTLVKEKEQPQATQIEADGTVFFTPQAPASGAEVRLRLKPAGLSTLAAIRLQLLPRIEHGGGIVRTQEKPALKVQPEFRLIPAQAGAAPQPLATRHADADHKWTVYFQGERVPGIGDAWRTSEKHWNQPQAAVWLIAKPVKLAAGDEIEVIFKDATFNDQDTGQLQTNRFVPSALRLALSPFASLHFSDSDLPSATLDDPALWLSSTAADTAAFTAWTEAERQRLDAREGRAHTLVTQSTDPATVRILPRGNWQDESGEIVRPATLSFIPGLSSAKGRAQNRVDLARWLTSAENPIPPRALMNRLWKQFFGTGLSAVLDDLGFQGEPPSHPELLDWLAAEFRDSGWDFQHMIRLIVSSRTYQQSSALRPDLRADDPANRLLAAQNPRRLEAEFIRDNALSIAGLLNPEIGGPSVLPYQPDDLYRDMEFPKRTYASSADAQQWRRGLYMHWQRTFLHPMLSAFDAPNRDESACTRTQANTPQQALTLLNDPTFVEAARVLAERLLGEKHLDDAARLRRAYELTLSRSPTAAEQKRLLSLLQAHRAEFQADPAAATAARRHGQAPVQENLPAPEVAAWASLSRVLLNLHETITRY